jgi:hypothetical protein
MFAYLGRKIFDTSPVMCIVRKGKGDEVPKYHFVKTRRSVMATLESLKVSESTKEKVRLASALLDVQQSKFVEAAIDEAIERRAVEFAKGVKAAEKALLGGKLEAAAFLLDEDVETLKKVSGS